jgi:hypothetical protein
MPDDSQDKDARAERLRKQAEAMRAAEQRPGPASAPPAFWSVRGKKIRAVRRPEVGAEFIVGEAPRSSEKSAVSEGSWLPKTWKELIPATIWGVIILGFGLEFVTRLVGGEYGRVLFALLGLGASGAMLLHGDQIRARVYATNPNWIVPALLVFLLAIVLSPFIEEKRWPLSAWFQPASVSPGSEQITIIHDPATPEQIEKAAGDELKTARAERDDYKRKLAEAQQNAPPAAAPAPPLMSAEAVLFMIQTLQRNYSEIMRENGDTKQRYLAIVAPPSQAALRNLLGQIIQNAPINVAILEPPDTDRIIDAPRLEIPNTNGVVMHGEDRLNSVLQSALQRCFVMKWQRTDDVAQKLSDFNWPNQHYIVLWLAFGSVGSPLKDPKGCS